MAEKVIDSGVALEKLNELIEYNKGGILCIS